MLVENTGSCCHTGMSADTLFTHDQNHIAGMVFLSSHHIRAAQSSTQVMHGFLLADDLLVQSRFHLCKDCFVINRFFLFGFLDMVVLFQALIECIHIIIQLLLIR